MVALRMSGAGSGNLPVQALRVVVMDLATTISEVNVAFGRGS